MYDFLGYYDICYVGGEVKNPGHVIPRSIVYSVLGVAAIYALTNLGLIAVVPWREAVHSKFIASDFMLKLYGARAASGVTVLVLWTALASVFALLFGIAGSLRGGNERRFLQGVRPASPARRISARIAPGDGRAFDRGVPVDAGRRDHGAGDFANYHPIHRTDLCARYLRRTQPEMPRPFKMWLYPLPSAIAFVGWAFLFLTSGWKFAGFGVLTLVAGVGAYWIWTRAHMTSRKVARIENDD